MSKLRRRFSRPTVIGITFLTVIGLSWTISTIVQAQSCGASGNPYCYNGTTVPCTAVTCGDWASTFPSDSAPWCFNNSSATAGYVTVTVTTLNWWNCIRSDNDADRCNYLTNATCANYELFWTKPDGMCFPACDNTSWVKYYCNSDTSNSQLCY